MKHFALSEFTYSVTAQREGIDNTPSAADRANIERMVAELLDPLREAWAIHCATERLGTPAITVTSGYRGFRLNAQVKGSASSSHCFGLAADLVPNNGKLKDFINFCALWLRSGRKAFDQLISEDEDARGVPSWVHIGHRSRNGRQRRELLGKREGVAGYYTKSL